MGWQRSAGDLSIVSGNLPTPGALPGETVLVVEDDPGIQNAVRRILDAAGYTVLVATTPMEAMELAADRQTAIHVLLTDIGLLGVTGPQLARLLVANRPGLRVLYISGQSEAHSLAPGRVGPGAAFLRKPFSMEALLQELRELLDQGRGANPAAAGGD
jgi:two-component system, cell cycle sensor histidine kinase and response regulator CckA